jgi:endogenous inhibitor of DNA gyrase (YacG/DUF329 family)
MSDRPTSTCPICNRGLPQVSQERPATKTHPFCSPRCKLVDLGNWLGDGYVIAGGSLDHLDESIDDETLAALLREPS